MKHTIESIRKKFQDRGFVLLSTSYEGYNTPLHYRCVCGTEKISTLRNFLCRTGLCKQCSQKQASKTEKIKNGGKFRFETEKFKEKRKEKYLENFGVESPLRNKDVLEKRRKTNIQKYGVPEVSLVPNIVKRQREGFRKKYGVDHFMQNPESVKKFRKTLMDKYGVPSMAFLSGRTSKESADFFTFLFNLLPDDVKDKCYFGPHTHEFNVWYQKQYFKYDFVQSSLKKCIEYNGSRFHPHPDQKETETGWCLFHPKKTVQQARQYESKKYQALLDRGFDILVIWDYEVKHDSGLLLNQCVEFLNGSRPGNWPNPTLLPPKPAFL